MLGTQTENNKSFYKALTIFLVILSVFFAIKVINQLHGRPVGKADGQTQTITVTGKGEVKAVPDIATVNFSIVKTAKTVKEAQAQVTDVETKALEVIKANNVEEKDIKTTDSSFNPTYDYRSGINCYGYGCPRTMVINGYEVRESIEIKVRDTDTLGKIIEEIGALGVSSLYGPNFIVEDEEELKLEARRIAIEKAKEEAKILAKDLGVRLGRLSSFGESNQYPYYQAKVQNAALDMAAEGSAAPELPAGEHTITSNVTITYEIR